MKGKKLLAAGLAVLCWFAGMQTSFADNVMVGSAVCKRNESGDFSVQMPKKSAISTKKTKSILNGITDKLPEAYDSREIKKNGISIVSPVRNQGAYGVCWAVSACSAAETSLLKKGMITENIQFSPLQLAYFTYHTVNNPLNISSRDETFLLNGNFLNSGGNEHLAANSLANWAGLAVEETVPYENATEILSSGLERNYAFSYDAAHLENAEWLYLNDFDGVKKKLIEYGAATAGIYMQTGSLYRYYNPVTAAYYCFDDTLYDYEEDSFLTNHQITIVGWDDNYSKSNFSVQPEKDGAWLVKNSWGSNWGNKGYFWLSYYDKSIYTEDENNSYGNSITFWDFASAENYDNNYYYDASGGIDWLYLTDDDTDEPVNRTSMANYYNAAQDEILEAVSFFTYQDDVEYNIKIYTEIPENGTFEDGRCALTLDGNLDFYGYHTIDFGSAGAENISLKQDERFAVIVELATDDEEECVFLPIEISGEWDWGVVFRASAKAGESVFFDPEEGWCDAEIDGTYFNFRIKAFTTSACEKQPGDVNMDGEVNAIDALTVLKVTAGMNELSLRMRESADVNKDEKTDAVDALLILKKTAHMITDF